MYIIIVIKIAERVPCGIALRGFCKSPDRFAPAIMPVTAGKKTAKTSQKPASSKLPINCMFCVNSVGARKIDISDNTITAITIY